MLKIQIHWMVGNLVNESCNNKQVHNVYSAVSVVEDYITAESVNLTSVFTACGSV